MEPNSPENRILEKNKKHNWKAYIYPLVQVYNAT
jgi:hypothetical protein